MVQSVVLILLIALSYALAAVDTTCKQDGEYCQNHWDCCSNTCLSFLYKCSHIALAADAAAPVQLMPAYFAPPLIPTQRPETMSLESLVQLIFPSNAIRSRLGKDDELDSKEEETTTISTTTEWNREEKTEEIINTTTFESHCREIGSKCYENEQCCSKRCHSYLHQCVT